MYSVATKILIINLVVYLYDISLGRTIVKATIAKKQKDSKKVVI